MKKIGVIGAGAMGRGIAQVAATAGKQVIVYDASAASLEQAKTYFTSTFAKLVEKNKMTEVEAQAIMASISYASSLADFASADLIIEAIIEQLDIKQKVFTELEHYVSDTCVLASNTSSLSISSIAAACKQPGRVFGIHFFNPAALMPLVEVIPGISSDAELTPVLKKQIESWKKIPVIAKDTPGFIVNRVARPFYGEAIRIWEERWEGLPGGEVGFATIDWAMRELGGFKMGPFELMDLIGHDVNYRVTETVWQQFFCDPRYKPSLTQKRLFEAGRYGKKTGQGYYNYSKPMPEPVKDFVLANKIFMRVLSMLINEAVDALYLDVASRDDIDLAMTKGVNYPKGLLKWADEIGLDKVLAQLQSLYDEYAEDRYRPSVLLKKQVRENRTFYTI